jgi:hypothetical protein
VSGSDICGFFSLLSENPIVDPLRAFLLLLCTGKCREVRLFLGKSRAGIGHSVYTRSENALADFVAPVCRKQRPRTPTSGVPLWVNSQRSSHLETFREIVRVRFLFRGSMRCRVEIKGENELLNWTLRVVTRQ